MEGLGEGDYFYPSNLKPKIPLFIFEFAFRIGGEGLVC